MASDVCSVLRSTTCNLPAHPAAATIEPRESPPPPIKKHAASQTHRMNTLRYALRRLDIMTVPLVLSGAALLLMAAYLLPARVLRNHCHAGLEEDEEAMAVDSAQAVSETAKKHNSNDWPPKTLDSPFEHDQKAAEQQLQEEFDRILATDFPLAEEVAQQTFVPPPDPVPVLYVNAKQFERILKRRAARRKLEDALRSVAARPKAAVRKPAVVGREVGVAAMGGR